MTTPARAQRIQKLRARQCRAERVALSAAQMRVERLRQTEQNLRGMANSLALQTGSTPAIAPRMAHDLRDRIGRALDALQPAIHEASGQHDAQQARVAIARLNEAQAEKRAERAVRDAAALEEMRIMNNHRPCPQRRAGQLAGEAE